MHGYWLLIARGKGWVHIILLVVFTVVKKSHKKTLNKGFGLRWLDFFNLPITVVLSLLLLVNKTEY